MANIPAVLKLGLSAETVYPTDSDKEIIRKVENNRYVIFMGSGSKSLMETYQDAKNRQAKKQQKKAENQETETKYEYY